MKYISPSLKLSVLAILVTLAGFANLHAASYDVFMVKGEILYEGSGENLTAGTILASGERIKFKDKESFAVLIGEGGRFTLTGANLGSKFKTGSFFTVKSATKKGKTNLEAREQPEFKSTKDIADFLGKTPFLILNECELKISPKTLKLNGDSQFILRIKKAGDIVAVTRRLPYKKGILVFNGDDISSIGSESMLSDFNLMVFRAVGQPMEQIAKLDLKIIDSSSPLRDEINKLTEVLRTSMGEDGMDEEDLKQNILDYVIEYYGTPEKENFESWVVEFL